MGQQDVERVDKFQFGDRVKDSVTGFAGTVTGRFEYMNGCIRYGLEAAKRDGSGIDELVFDEQRLDLVDVAADAWEEPERRTGGSRPAPPRSGSR